MAHMAEQQLNGSGVLKKIAENINCVVKGQEKTIRHLLSGFAGGGHILLEDYPGTGKTTMAKTLALSMDTGFKRVQFTPDLLPSDILGVSIFDPKERLFQLHKGPIFTNVLLVDEINRSSPRTQSALLEAMAEKQVSIDGKLCKLEDLFFVIATQNPVESHGTYPLPEAQMDRFAMQLSLGYISSQQELAMLTAQEKGHPIESVSPCVTFADVLALKKEVEEIHISDELKFYIVELVKATRTAPGVLLGGSPRASLALMKIAKALALYDNQAFVTPDHIQELAVPVIAHRIILDHQARFSGGTAQGIIADILSDIPVPA
ncbi:MAG: MoxR family ATPase [bacterium]|nr:MoxR family ATPase [bacterium]